MKPIGPVLLGSTALTRLGRVTAGVAIISSHSAMALPQNGSVAGGSANIVQTSPTQLDITQNTSRAVINWQSFSIGSGETTNFHQPSTNAIAVNRVTGVDPSQIMGNLNANGQVVLVNPNGILFSKSAQVNVGGLIASTSGITTQNAMAGNMVFDQPGNAGATVVNQGTITAAEGGLVALVAPGVANSGVITATLGKVSLASGDEWTLDLYGDHLVSFAVNDQIASSVAGVTQSGTISVAGGTVELSANVAKGIVSNAINMSGIVEATSVASAGGTIVLSAPNSGVAITGTADASGTSGGTITVSADSIVHQGTLTANGSAVSGGAIALNAGSTYIDTANALTTANGSTAGGSIAVSAGASLYSAGRSQVKSSGGVGGTVTMTAPTTDLVGAAIDATGALGGGTISIGSGPLAQAATTNVTGSSTLDASATVAGNGGTITIWSDDDTKFAGTTYAKGGASSGNGGSIEVSSAGSDSYAGISDASAANGVSGQLLLDPKTIIVSSSAALFPQFQFLNPNASIGGTFGSVTLGLSSGNVVITDPTATIGLGPAETGAAYLFNGVTGQLISVLTGSYADDKVGSTVTALTQGNYVVSESTWNGGIGAASWASGTLGITGVVSAANSLTGSTAGDNVGLSVTALTDGNYIVGSSNWNGGKGAATWGNGSLGLSGTVSASNSLIGSSAGDHVGLKVTALTNGDYVVGSPDWNGDKGAASWGNGATGLTGTISASNSLIGSTAGDEAGLTVTALTNGDYVVGSPDWGTNKGAATWGNGGSGVTGTISAANSLIGSTSSIAGIGGDQVGLSVTALTNGDYVVGSPDWGSDKGAASWGNGSLGLSGTVSASNSLIGSSTGDDVGLTVTALTNGDYVVGSPDWSTDKGAASWGNGATGLSGTISAANSLIGSTSSIAGIGGDQVGLSVTALTDGNYVVGSPDWSGDKGAATWGNGATGVKGTISSSNSLIGSLVTDQVGLAVTALANGNYVVQSPLWDGTIGAATWGSGAVGITGTISSTNSLVGTLVGDEVGLHVTALSDGNYVVGSPLWDLTLGAASWGSGTLGITGVVSSSNSLIGSLTGDLVGSAVTALNAGAYVVGSFGWDGGLGAATYGVADTALTGTVSTLNSIVGGSILSIPLVTINSLAASGNFTVSFGSAGTGSVYEGFTNPNQLTYSADQNGTVTIAPSFITQVLNTGTAVTLQANDDITINSPIIATGDGALTLQAGRSVLINGNISTDNGNLTVIANDTAADGVINADRDTGNAVISMASGTTLNAGTGTVSITTQTGAGITNAASGGITLNNVTGSTISVIDQTQNSLTLNGALTASASGDSIAIATGIITDNDGSSALNPGAGRYILYSTTPLADTLTGLAGFAEHYGISYAIDPPADYTSGGNYSFYSITPTVTITADNASRTYGSANPTLSYSASGLINGDTIATALTAAPTLTTSATTASTVGSYTVTIANSLSSSLGYDIVTNTGALSITPAALTITANNASRLYGAANPAFSASYNGLVNGDASGVVSGLTLASTATLSSSVGSYAITATGASALNYSISYGANGTLSIGQAPLTITANNASRLYGANNPAFTATYSGLVNGDGSGVVTNLLLTTSATTASNVGSYMITASNGAATNYAITYVNGTLSVTPAPLTITANNASRVYGAANPAFSVTYSGLVNNDTSSSVTGLTLGTSATSASNVGSYAITASGGSDANYTISYGPSGTLSVTPAALTISANNASRVYGAANPAFTATYNGLVNGDTSAAIAGLTLSTTATTASNVGTYAIAATGASDANYTITYGSSGVLSVTPAALTITANNASRIYGAANPAFSASYNGFVNGDGSGVVSNLSLTTSATSASNVGSYAITGTGATASNYTISYVNGTLAIGQAPLTITASNASRLYGANNPAFTATYSGLVNGDGSGVVTNLLLTTTATSASNVGSYAITASNGAATNYAITYVNGVLSVTPAALTITANNASRIYGASNPSFTATYTGLVNNDTSAVVSGLSLTTSATSASNVGSYSILGSNAVAGNYNISYVNGSLSVTPAALTITANNASRVYGSANPAFTATYSGLVNGDTSSAITGLTLATSATTASNVGSYAITATGGSDSNYTISYGSAGILSVTPAALTITADNASRLYGAANPAFTATYSGLVNGDGSGVVTNLLLTTSATTASNVGSYAITASNGAATNYTISYVNGILQIAQAPLTITSNNSSRVYGSANPAFSATYSGLVNGDSSSVVSGLTLSTIATSASNVGLYAITSAGASAQNYAITYGSSGMLTVTPASLTITADNSSRSYGAPNPAFSATYTGLVNGDSSSAVTGLVLSSNATTASSVGSYAIAASGGAAANYTISYGPSGTLTVTPVALTITPDNSSRLYGSANPALSATYSGLVNGDSSAAIIGYSLTTSATSASNAGSYAITGSGGSDANYTISYGPSGTLTVTPAPLTITTANASRVYGQANPTFSASYSGFVNGDGSSAVTGLTLATSATTASNVGSYTITASGASAGNYAITYGPSGMLSITPAALTITPNNATRLYGASNLFSASFSGLTAGDSAAAITGLTLSSPATTSSNVGTYAITASGANDANYTISYGPSATLTVTPAPLTIVPNESSRLYGASNTLSASYEGLAGGDTSASITGVVLSTTATSTSPLGSYPIMVTGGSNSNYTITDGPDATLLIVPPPSTVAPNPPTATDTSTTASSSNATQTSMPVPAPDIIDRIQPQTVAQQDMPFSVDPTAMPQVFSQITATAQNNELSQAEIQLTSNDIGRILYNTAVTPAEVNSENITCIKYDTSPVATVAGVIEQTTCAAPLAIRGY